MPYPALAPSPQSSGTRGRRLRRAALRSFCSWRGRRLRPVESRARAGALLNMRARRRQRRRRPMRRRGTSRYPALAYIHIRHRSARPKTPRANGLSGSSARARPPILLIIIILRRRLCSSTPWTSSRGRRLIIRRARGGDPPLRPPPPSQPKAERGRVCGKRARRRPLFPCKTEASRRCRRLTRALQQKNNRAAPTVPNNHSLCDNIRSV